MIKSKNKGYILTYDRVQMPEGLKMREVANLVQKGYVLYDGSKGAKGQKPEICHLGGVKNKQLLKAKFIDISKR